MRGRYPLGLEGVDQLPGSGIAKERLKAILETLVGDGRVGETCERLEISQQRFHQLREKLLTVALNSLEPRRAGRRPRVVTPAEQEIQQLKARVAELEVEVQAARTREEIALILPRVGQGPPEKKTPAKEPKRRGRPPGTRKNT